MKYRLPLTTAAALLTVAGGITMINRATVAQEGEAQPATTQPAAPEGMESVEQQASYGIGYNFGLQLTQSTEAAGLNLDMDTVLEGARDGLKGAEPALSPEQIQQAMMALQGQVQAQQAEKAQANQAAAQQFLEANKAKEGVQVTESGLQYKVVEAGEGQSPTAEDTVRVHYEGKLLDGTVFDSSYQRGEPVTFPVNGVIPGWTEALQLMKPGAKWQLVIPAELGYGERGGGPIPGNAVLIFDVELLDVNPEEG